MNNSEAPDLKRKRNAKDDNSEFMPLSKRINSLDLNQQNDKHLPDVNNYNYQNHEIPDSFITPPGSVQTTYTDELGRQQTTSSAYMPSLDKSQNPVYFEPNELLFNLYLERSSRRGNKYADNS